MKKIIYLLLLFFSLSLLWSCDKKEDEEEDEGTIIPQGWTKNEDLATLGKYPWYLHRSGNDSIKIEFYQFGAVYNHGGLRYRYYKKNSQGKYSSVNFSYLNNAYSIEKNGEKEILGQGYKLKNYGMRYKLIDAQTVIIYNLPELEPFKDGLEFKAVNEKKYSEKNRLKGGWYNSQVVDSTVLAFEDNTIKEYLFIRGGSTIEDSWEYGEYSATRTDSFLQNEYLGAICDLRFNDFYKENCTYKIVGDNLTIYWNSPRKTTTYKRIKQ